MTWAEWKGSRPGRILKTLPARLKQVDQARRRIRLRITATQVDRDGEVVVAAGAKLDAFLENPVVLYSHDSRLPVGIVTELEVREDEIEAEVAFTPESNPQFGTLAEGLFQAYATGFLRAASIGFLPVEVTERRVVSGQTGRAFLEWELLELSLVAIPSLREALTTDQAAVLARKGILTKIDRGLAVASRRWAPVDPVRQEFLAVLRVIEGMLTEVRYDLAVREVERAMALVQIIGIQEELEGWR